MSNSNTNNGQVSMPVDAGVAAPAGDGQAAPVAAAAGDSRGTLAIIDGNSLMHRAFHAVMFEMNAPDGRPTNACFGFMSMFLKLAEDFKPDGIICAFDLGIPAFRFEAIQAYKAQRPPTDANLKQQFPMMKKLLEAMSIPVVQLEGWEGDDILGSLAARAEQEGYRCLLVTGDKDALQLASDKTQIINTKKGMSDVVIYDPNAVRERWGIGPEQVPDFLGLMGDNSDNIPGVPSVGPKTATKLLQQYGSLEAVLEHADELKGKLGENVRDNRQQALASKVVATIRRDVDLDCDLGSVRFPDFDIEAVKAAFGELELKSPLRKLLALAGRTGQGGGAAGTAVAGARPAVAWPAAAEPTAAGQAASGPAVDGLATGGLAGAGAAVAGDAPAVSLVLNLTPPLTGDAASAALAAVLDAASSAPAAPPVSAAPPVAAAPDTAAAAGIAPAATTAPPAPAASGTAPAPHTSTSPGTAPAPHTLHTLNTAPALALYCEASSGESLFDSPALVYVASADGIMCFEEQQLPQLCEEILRRGTLVAHDSKQLLAALMPRNCQQPCLMDPQDIDMARVFDLSLAAYLLDSSKDYSNIGLLAERFFDGELPEPSEGMPQGAIYSKLLYELYSVLQGRLVDDGSWDCFRNIEMPLVKVLAQMERWGANVDRRILSELSQQLALSITRLQERAVAEAGEGFNLDSPKQLGSILFDKLKLPAVKKTRTGYSTDAAVLQELKALHPLPGVMLEYRELAKLKSTYLDALPLLIASDGHIHTSFNQTVAATGRLSSSEPNLQNIPVRTEMGRQIRTAFVPDAAQFSEGQALFMSADYSQIELRLLAHLSGDEGLIEAFLGGEDFHASTAARVFGLPVGEVTPQLRSRAKAVNFGIVYGQQAYGLSQTLGASFQEAQEMINRYFQAYPQVREYLDATVAEAKQQGWVSTLYGRKRHIPELLSSNANMRAFGERTAMNHPMQGSAADIIKLAMIEVQRRLNAEGFISQMVLQVHDELDFNCAASEQQRLAEMVRQAMEGVVALKVPLVVEVSLGANWAEAH